MDLRSIMTFTCAFGLWRGRALGMPKSAKSNRFKLGQVVATPEALRLLGHLQAATLIARHASGDWGDLQHDEDRRANEEALVSGARLLSRYDVNGESFYVITEADRSSTCLLLREEY